ncbi:MAG: SDR family oxidoreductase [Ktedonobacteraceae bacterium]|nr:SDR family oxidoreductase [Ktedonobacteraceae bacterium]
MTQPVFLITGASTGIGAATARHAVQNGYRVVLAARSVEKLESLVNELGGHEQALAVLCDVAEWPDQEALVKKALETFGQLDVVYANAGFTDVTDTSRPSFLDDKQDVWRSMILTNVYGTALTVRATLPALKASRGHLLLTGSVVGRRVVPGSLYSCTKWAVSAMGEAVRQELIGSGVRVTLIEPGIVDTPFYKTERKGALAAEDIAQAVLFAVNQPQQVAVNEILVRATDEAF